MMKIRIIAIGKNKQEWVEQACRHYEKLLKRFCQIDWDIIASPAKTKHLPPPQIRTRESGLLQSRIKKGPLVALCDTGKSFDSLNFSKYLQKTLNQSQGPLQFVIGGPYGLSNEIIKQAGSVLSLSPLTFSHQLVRPILLEQLYRGFSILNKTDYHK